MKHLKKFNEEFEFDFDDDHHKEMSDLAESIVDTGEFKRIWNENLKESGGRMTSNFMSTFVLDVLGEVLSRGYKINKFTEGVNESDKYPGMREVEPGVWKPKGALAPGTPMRKFVVTTTSESGDDYIYFIEHYKEPTSEDLEKFLMTYGSDKDEDQTYENVQDIKEIKNFQKIPR